MDVAEQTSGDHRHAHTARTPMHGKAVHSIVTGHGGLCRFQQHSRLVRSYIESCGTLDGCTN
eukprot:6455143-Amphidinium_carterae.2